MQTVWRRAILGIVLGIGSVYAQEESSKVLFGGGGEERHEEDQEIQKYDGRPPLQGHVNKSPDLAEFQVQTPKMDVLRLDPGDLTFSPTARSEDCAYVTIQEKHMNAGGQDIVVRTPIKKHAKPPCVSSADANATRGLIQQGDRFLVIDGVDYSGTVAIDHSLNESNKLLNRGVFSCITIVIEREGKVLSPFKVQWNFPTNDPKRPPYFWTQGDPSYLDAERLMDAGDYQKYIRWKKTGFDVKSDAAPKACV